jgi:hypothetical protein
MEQSTRRPLFPLGQVVATPGALAALRRAGQGPPEFLRRHASGDNGKTCAQGTARKTSSARNAASKSFPATAPLRAMSFGSSPTTTSR